jgi:hypothetical protein
MLRMVCFLVKGKWPEHGDARGRPMWPSATKQPLWRWDADVQSCRCVVFMIHIRRMFILYCIVLYYIILYFIILYCIILYFILLYYILLYYIILYCIVLYYIALYCIILYCSILYYIILYFMYYYIYIYIYSLMHNHLKIEIIGHSKVVCVR